jgi:hypothetical protein
MMEPTEPTPAPRELDILLSTGINVLSTLVPGWQPPVLAHPHAVPYKTLLRLRDNIVPGDQVMALAPSGYSHHGIYVGMQSVGGEVVSAVVDFWGEGNKDSASIGVRSLDDFAIGAAGFAKAKYPQGAALPHELSARLALAWVDARVVSNYNLALNNCEVFATICRCARCAVACHGALALLLADLPAFAPAPVHRGFK